MFENLFATMEANRKRTASSPLPFPLSLFTSQSTNEAIAGKINEAGKKIATAAGSALDLVTGFFSGIVMKIVLAVVVATVVYIVISIFAKEKAKSWVSA